MPPLIYHYVNVTRPYASLNVQLKVDDPDETRLVLLGRHKKLPIVGECDFVFSFTNVTKRDGRHIFFFLNSHHILIINNIFIFSSDVYIDLFVPKELVANHTGKWYLGVFSLADNLLINETIKDGKSCAEQGAQMTLSWMQDNFMTETYVLQVNTGGSYSFNTETETWESIGMTV
jgi:hypothetical protein